MVEVYITKGTSISDRRVKGSRGASKHSNKSNSLSSHFRGHTGGMSGMSRGMSNSSFSIRDLDLVSEASAGKVVSSLDTMLLLEAVDHFIQQSELENSDFVIKKFMSSYLRRDFSGFERSTVELLLLNTTLTSRNWVATRVWVVYDFILTHFSLLHDKVAPNTIPWTELFTSGLSSTVLTELHLKKHLCGEFIAILKKIDKRFTCAMMKSLRTEPYTPVFGRARMCIGTTS